MATIIILAVFGIVLVGLEVFLPGGVLGVVGIGCSVTSIIFCFTTEEVTEVGLWLSFLLAACVVVVTTVALVFWMKHFQQTGIGKRFVLDSKVKGAKEDRGGLVGQIGETVGELRPLGKVQIDGVKLDARAESGVVPAGIRVQVVKATGLELVVRAVVETADV